MQVMVFDKDFTHYATAYSFFSLISDLAYGNETNGWLLDEARKEICLLYELKEGGEYGSNIKAAMGFSIKGLVQKFFPETVDLKVLFADPNKSNLLNHIMSGTVYDEKSTKKQVHKGIIKAVENGEQYYSWRKKIKNEIQKWFENYSQEEFLPGIVKQIVCNIYMMPKCYTYSEKGNNRLDELEIKYCKKSIFELLRIDENEKKLCCSSTDDLYSCLEEGEIVEEFNSLKKAYEEGRGDHIDYKMIFDLRSNEVNSKIKEGKCLCFEGTSAVEEYIFENNLFDQHPISLLKNIYNMGKNEPMELLVSMFIFSITLNYLILKEGKLYVKSSDEKKHLLYKLFYEFNEGKELSDINIDRENVENNINELAEKIALCDNYHFYDKEKELIEQYEEKSRLLGLKFYSKQNPRCYINMFLINLGDEYLKEKELNTETLYETIFTYCQAQSEAIKRNQKFFGDALIQYAIYLGENQTKYSKDKIESIISILDLLGENNRYEYFLLVAEQCKKTAIENRQNNNIDIELYKKQYNAYLKGKRSITECLMYCSNP